MRTGGGYAVQQALGAEAAGAVREAASLARRRGHWRVTPLHVVSAMLSAPAGLLRAACVMSPLSHSHALELRLSAALGRLRVAWPAAAAPPPLALSNALVAALKRASARQRSMGGSINGRTRQSAAAAPDAITMDVEIEHLVLSVLDDPSVDRAMREAGHSSSQVKANVESINAASLERPVGSCMTCANPVGVYKKAMAGAHPSHGGADMELLYRPQRSLALSLTGYHSGDQTAAASQAKHRPARPEHHVGGSEVVTASLPPWLRRCQDPTFLIRSPIPISTSLCTPAAATCRRRPKFTELTAENLKIMCNALELRLRHRRLEALNVDAAGIAAAVLWARSGMRRRMGRSAAAAAAATTSCWLLLQGEDVHAKKAVAEELASLVFGSGEELASFTLADYSATANSGSLVRKRSRDDGGDGYDFTGVIRRLLFEAIAKNPHRVVWIDGAEQLDHDSKIAIRNTIIEGRIADDGDDGRVVSLEDAVVVLSSNPCRGEGERSMEKGAKSRRFSFDLNTCQEEEEDDPADDVGMIMNAVDGVFSFE